MHNFINILYFLLLYKYKLADV